MFGTYHATTREAFDTAAARPLTETPIFDKLIEDRKDEIDYATFGQLDPQDFTKMVPVDEKTDPTERKETIAHIVGGIIILVLFGLVISPAFGSVTELFRGQATMEGTSHFEPAPAKEPMVDPQILQDTVGQMPDTPPVEQHATASHLDPTAGIPFDPRALPKLIEIDMASATASSLSDGATGHMEKLQPFGW